MADFEHEDTELIICPWCGYQYQESWEFGDEGENECLNCEERFTHRRLVDITYDTEKVEP